MADFLNFFFIFKFTLCFGFSYLYVSNLICVVADFSVIRFPRTRFLQRSAAAAGASSRWWSVSRCSISSQRIGRMRAVWDGTYLLQPTSPYVDVNQRHEISSCRQSPLYRALIATSDVIALRGPITPVPKISVKILHFLVFLSVLRGSFPGLI